MIIFVLALLVLIGAVVVNFLPSFKTSRVLVMSVLAILMIMINFINQVDIVVSPPQFLVRVDSSFEGHGKIQVIRLNFKQEFETKKMNYLTTTLSKVKQSSQTSLKQSTQLTQQQKKSSLQQLQFLPPISHLKPIIKPEIYLMQQLKSKLIQSQDSIIQVQGIDKVRFQMLMQFYIKDVNEKRDSYGIKFDKVMFVPVYRDVMGKGDSKGYKFGKLSEKNCHYIVVFDSPSQKLLQFLYEQYMSPKSSYLSIIFLQLDQKINIFPISQLIEHIHLPQMNYLQPITQFFLSQSSSTTKDKTQSKESLNKMQRELQMCEKYLDMDYELFLKLIAQRGHKTVAKICYQILIEPLSEEIECLRAMVENQDDQIPLYKAKQCWRGKNQPQGLIKTVDDKIKLQKHHFWANKVSPTNFGLQVVTKKCTNQL